MIVEIAGLTKVYQDKQQRTTAVDGIDLTVEEGELFGLLGPNGAGKTTTIGICTTRTLPTGGHVAIAGVDVVARPALARRNIGVVPQYNTLDRSLTIFENLYYHCKYFGFSGAEARERADGLLKQFLLHERAESFPSQLSEVSSSACRSREQSPTGLPCCFLTSRVLASTRKAVSPCGTQSARYARKGSP